jgi:hypothetical protein
MPCAGGTSCLLNRAHFTVNCNTPDKAARVPHTWRTSPARSCSSRQRFGKWTMSLSEEPASALNPPTTPAPLHRDAPPVAAPRRHRRPTRLATCPAAVPFLLPRREARDLLTGTILPGPPHARLAALRKCLPACHHQPGGPKGCIPRAWHVSTPHHQLPQCAIHVRLR